MVSTSAKRQPDVRQPIVQPWVPLASLALSVAGLAVAIYLTVEHYTSSSTLACPDTGALNCFKVTTSAQSSVLGIPVALLGLVFFAVMVPLSLPALWRSHRRELRLARLAVTAVGVLFVFYLVVVELFVVDAICLWCTAVHVLSVALFAVTAYGTAYADPADLTAPPR